MRVTYWSTGNAHYLLEYRYYGFTAIRTAVGAFPENNSVILGHFSMQESCFYTRLLTSHRDRTDSIRNLASGERAVFNNVQKMI